MRHNDILERFTKLNKPAPKQREIAEALSYQIGIIGKRASRNSEYNLEERIKLSEYFGIDLLDDNENLRLVLQKSDNNVVELDYFEDVFGSCGSGAFVLSEATQKIQVPMNIIEGYCRVKRYSVINAIGDSMQPFIHDRDLLIVEHYEGEQIRDNRIYVFRIGENIFIKRLVLNINQLVIKSDNREYEPRTIEKSDLEEVQIIGQIVGLMRGTR